MSAAFLVTSARGPLYCSPAFWPQSVTLVFIEAGSGDGCHALDPRADDEARP